MDDKVNIDYGVDLYNHNVRKLAAKIYARMASSDFKTSYDEMASRARDAAMGFYDYFEEMEK